MMSKLSRTHAWLDLAVGPDQIVHCDTGERRDAGPCERVDRIAQHMTKHTERGVGRGHSDRVRARVEYRAGCRCRHIPTPTTPLLLVGALRLRLGDWMAGWLDGWLAGWLVGWATGWLGGWVAGWLGGWWLRRLLLLAAGAQQGRRPAHELHRSRRIAAAALLRLGRRGDFGRCDRNFDDGADREHRTGREAFTLTT